MCKLTPVTRRLFGQGLGACLALALSGRTVSARGEKHVRQVRVSEFAFAPSRLEIDAGDTVVWFNEDLAPHTATAVDGNWGTDAILTGQQSRLVFEEPGEFAYYCAFHPHMTGTVSVRAKRG